MVIAGHEIKEGVMKWVITILLIGGLAIGIAVLMVAVMFPSPEGGRGSHGFCGLQGE